MLRLWPVVVLGNRFSGLVAIQPGHTLVTRGVYGVICHPSYLGLLVNSLGWALAFRAGVGVLLTAPMLPPMNEKSIPVTTSGRPSIVAVPCTAPASVSLLRCASAIRSG